MKGGDRPILGTPHPHRGHPPLTGLLERGIWGGPTGRWLSQPGRGTTLGFQPSPWHSWEERKVLGRCPRPAQLPALSCFGNDLLGVPELLEHGWAWSWVSELSLDCVWAPHHQALSRQGGHVALHPASHLTQPPALRTHLQEFVKQAEDVDLPELIVAQPLPFAGVLGLLLLS